MNGIYQKNTLEASVPAAITFPDWQMRTRKIKRAVGSITIVLTGLASLFLLVLLKSKTAIDFSGEPFFFVYSIFVTTFVLSRIVSALFYKKTLSAVLDRRFSLFPDKKYEPPVTFVIPCKNEEKDIANTVEKCFEADYPTEKMEVIVINDGSTDGTLNVLQNLQKKFENLTVINFEKNRGKRHAMAEGFRRARGEIIVQMDSDSYIVPETFREIVAPFQHPEIAGVCAHADPTNADKNIITRMQAAYYFTSFRILKAAESTYLSVFCLSGCASAYRKSATLPVLDDWLNEKFLGLPATWGDDRSLTSWLLKDGHSTVYTDRALAKTIVPDSVRTLFKQQLRWKKSWIVNAFLTGKFIWKTQPFVSAIYYFPLIFVSFVTPFMAFRAMVWAPLVHQAFPWHQIAGILLVTAILAAYYRFLDRKNTHWPYLFLWSTLNLAALAFVMFWALIKIQDRGWGTR
jgi:hyaluronan synthase